ncbi:MAG: YhbY family RNA-binding protein [Promethearchaeota archaeon]|nr:MAG: YhbY family RNA-binding protein [Candidatus Lokiarchaeota archaeon]
MSYQKEFNKALLSQPHCILGKKGVNNKFIDHLNVLLKRYKTIKVKALKSVATKSNIKELAQEIAQLTNSSLIDIRGKIFILSLYDTKKKNKNITPDNLNASKE